MFFYFNLLLHIIVVVLRSYKVSIMVVPYAHISFTTLSCALRVLDFL